jgi:hypothetical protein
MVKLDWNKYNEHIFKTKYFVQGFFNMIDWLILYDEFFYGFFNDFQIKLKYGLKEHNQINNV